MNRDEFKQAVKDDFNKEKTVWQNMDSAQKELVIILVMIAVVLASLTSWFFF